MFIVIYYGQLRPMSAGYGRRQLATADVVYMSQNQNLLYLKLSKIFLKAYNES